jgi:hypothetical protein
MDTATAPQTTFAVGFLGLYPPTPTTMLNIDNVVVYRR